MTKNEIRKEYKLKRNSLNIAERTSFDNAIFEHLRTIDWGKYTFLHVYLPLAKFGEPDTLVFIKWMKEHFPDIKIVVSKSNLVTHEMENYLLDEASILKENEWGILEPIGGELVSPEKIDAVLVPLLVVDQNGNRVGYGKGFYDRFLVQCRVDVFKIGISYFEPVATISDVNEWDVRLDACTTPAGIYSFK